MIVVILGTFLLAGCGSEAGNRMGGGMAGGAATGATFGLIGGPIGVVIGGALGGGIGALTANNTSPKQLDLGNPPWAGGPGSTAGGTGSNAANTATTNSSDLRGQIDQYRSNSGTAQAPSSYAAPSSYGRPQPLYSPNQGQAASGQSGYGAGGVQAQPLAPPVQSQ